MSHVTGADARAGGRARAGAPAAPPRRATRLALVRDHARPVIPAWRRLAGYALLLMTLGALVLAAMLTTVRIE